MEALWIITLVFGGVASLIAHSKGRNALGWFMAGTFIGPFALIVAFLPPIAREGMYSKCPACAEVVRVEASTCRYCHAALVPS